MTRHQSHITDLMSCHLILNRVFQPSDASQRTPAPVMITPVKDYETTGYPCLIYWQSDNKKFNRHVIQHAGANGSCSHVTTES